MTLEELEAAVAGALQEFINRTPCHNCQGSPMLTEMNHKYVSYYILEMVKRFRSPDITKERVRELANKATQRRIRREMSAEMNAFVDQLGGIPDVGQPTAAPVAPPPPSVESAPLPVEPPTTPAPGPSDASVVSPGTSPGDAGEPSHGDDPSGGAEGPELEPVAPGTSLLSERDIAGLGDPSVPDLTSPGPQTPSAPVAPSPVVGRSAVKPPECPGCRQWLLPGGVCPTHGKVD